MAACLQAALSSGTPHSMGVLHGIQWVQVSAQPARNWTLVSVASGVACSLKHMCFAAGAANVLQATFQLAAETCARLDAWRPCAAQAACCCLLGLCTPAVPKDALADAAYNAKLAAQQQLETEALNMPASSHWSIPAGESTDAHCHENISAALLLWMPATIVTLQ